jgi:superfamily I DNA and/or RNA helicase
LTELWRKNFFQIKKTLKINPTLKEYVKILKSPRVFQRDGHGKWVAIRAKIGDDIQQYSDLKRLNRIATRSGLHPEKLEAFLFQPPSCQL